MVWVLVDVAVVLVALVLVALAGLGLWHRVRALGRAVGVASAQVAGLTDALDAVGAPREPAVASTAFSREHLERHSRTSPREFTSRPSRHHVSQAPQTPSGVRSTSSPEGGTP